MAARRSDSLSLGWIILLSPFAFLFSLCSSPDSEKKEVKRFESFSFNGIKIPGTTQDAKAAGFTDCKSDNSGFLCRKNEAEIEGTTVHDLTVALSGKDSFAINRFDEDKNVAQEPTAYTYRTVTASLPKTEYEQKCLDAARKKSGNTTLWPYPIECRSNDGIDYFQHDLKNHGWIEVTGRGAYRYFYRENTPIYFEFRSGSTTFDISPTEISDVNRTLNQVRDRAKAETEKKQSEQKFITEMKQ